MVASTEAIQAGASEHRHMHYSVCRRFPMADPRDMRGTQKTAAGCSSTTGGVSEFWTLFLEAEGGLFALRDRGTIFRLRILTAASFTAGTVWWGASLMLLLLINRVRGFSETIPLRDCLDRNTELREQLLHYDGTCLKPQPTKSQ